VLEPARNCDGQLGGIAVVNNDVIEFDFSAQVVIKQHH
jgi:hypothetical protein